jgi:hypothetical protein
MFRGIRSALRKPAALSLIGTVLVLGAVDDRDSGCSPDPNSLGEPNHQTTTYTPPGGSSHQLDESVRTPSGG